MPAILNLLDPIQAELPRERVPRVLVEIPRENLLDKGFNVMYLESSSMGQKGDNRRVSRLFNIFEHAMQFL
jgi:hypothetical protein